MLRREPFDRPVQTNDLDELEELLLSLDGGPPRDPGAARLGQDVDVRAPDRAPARGGEARRGRLDEPQGDPQAARGGRGGGDRGSRASRRRAAGNPESFYEGERIENVTDRPDCGDAPLLGGTAWLFARGDLDGSLDYLFIDEAGQVSLADALAMGTAARNVVLVGDPLQLAQVLQGTHPDGADASVLTHLLGEHATIPEDRGIFLERTFRLHPDVCGYISEEFYEGRLRHDPCTEARGTPLGTGLRFIEVAARGASRRRPRRRSTRSRPRSGRLLAAGVRRAEVMVVAPYNAQVNLLRERLSDAVRVGTVDKFQGQEALVVLYSMASSSGEDVPHGLEFLLSRNRLNVAISRAQCLAYLVASPRLLEVNCRTIDQMRLGERAVPLRRARCVSRHRVDKDTCAFPC